MGPLQVGSQINPAKFANKSHKKSETLADSVPVWTIRAGTTVVRCMYCMVAFLVVDSFST